MIKPYKTLFGIDRLFEENLYRKFAGYKIGLLCNQASTDRKFVPSFLNFKRYFKDDFKLIFSPQHGLYSEKQANMIGSEDEVEVLTKVPVVSLYGPRLEPDEKVLEEIDILFVDLQEVGCRVYTYIWTLFLVLRRCEEKNKKVVILDRPNPIGGWIEGPILEKEFFSFVGLDTLPMRHGLTIGELAYLFKKRHFKNLDLEVIPLKFYRKSLLWWNLDREWILPSPNVPCWRIALVYPGQVLLEGTNLSEGRGTTLPFLVFGAPYINIEKFITLWEKLDFPEKKYLYLRPFVFEPTFDKWKQKRCFGFQIHVLDYIKYRPVKTTLFILKLVRENYKEFKFISGPYEFEKRLRPIDILVGNSSVLRWLEGKEEIDLDFWLYYILESYVEEIKEITLYEQ